MMSQGVDGRLQLIPDRRRESAQVWWGTYMGRGFHAGIRQSEEHTDTRRPA